MPVLGESVDSYDGGDGTFLFKLTGWKTGTSAFRAVYADKDWDGDWNSFTGLKVSFDVDVIDEES